MRRVPPSVVSARFAAGSEKSGRDERPVRGLPQPIRRAEACPTREGNRLVEAHPIP